MKSILGLVTLEYFSAVKKSSERLPRRCIPSRYQPQPSLEGPQPSQSLQDGFIIKQTINRRTNTIKQQPLPKHKHPNHCPPPSRIRRNSNNVVYKPTHLPLRLKQRIQFDTLSNIRSPHPITSPSRTRTSGNSFRIPTTQTGGGSEKARTTIGTGSNEFK